MDIGFLNPYVRYARRNEISFYDAEYVAVDHRIFIIEKGEAEFIIDGRSYLLKKGDIIFWKSGKRYIVKMKKDCVISGCNFDFMFKEKCIASPIPPNKVGEEEEVIENPDFENVPILGDMFVINDAYALIDKFHEIYSEFEAKKLFYQDRCSCLLKEILLICIRMTEAGYADKNSKVATDILEYIKEHIEEPVTNKSVAQQFNYHPNYVGELVKKHTGMSLHKYILNCKIYVALDMLQYTKYTISEIAERLGFTDISHFSKTFKAIIGYNPKYYRK